MNSGYLPVVEEFQKNCDEIAVGLDPSKEGLLRAKEDLRELLINKTPEPWKGNGGEIIEKISDAILLIKSIQYDIQFGL